MVNSQWSHSATQGLNAAHATPRTSVGPLEERAVVFTPTKVSLFTCAMAMMWNTFCLGYCGHARVCMYACMYVCMYVYVCMHVCVCMYVCMHVCLYVHPVNQC